MPKRYKLVVENQPGGQRLLCSLSAILPFANKFYLLRIVQLLQIPDGQKIMDLGSG